MHNGRNNNQHNANQYQQQSRGGHQSSKSKSVKVVSATPEVGTPQLPRPHSVHPMAREQPPPVVNHVQISTKHCSFYPFTKHFLLKHFLNVDVNKTKCLVAASYVWYEYGKFPRWSLRTSTAIIKVDFKLFQNIFQFNQSRKKVYLNCGWFVFVFSKSRARSVPKPVYEPAQVCLSPKANTNQQKEQNDDSRKRKKSRSRYLQY